MKSWRPDFRNETGPLAKGPSTRILKLPKSRGRSTIKVLSHLSGDKFANWANRTIRLIGKKSPNIEFDRQKKLYVSTDGSVHVFSHPKRIWTVWDGHLSRGRGLAYQYLLDQIEFEEDDRIIDIGANAGDLSLCFLAMGRKVKIDAFEPSPRDFTALQENLSACDAITEHEAHNCALWNEDAEGLTFYIASGKADSSLHPIDGASETVQVRARRLDEILTDDSRRYKLLKLEAEGAEPEILEGAKGILNRVEYISADVGFERGKTAESTLPQVTNFLAQHGFEIIGFDGFRFVLLFKNSKMP